MRLTKLLVMGALLLVGKSAWAVDANVWTKPAIPDAATMELGAEYYFYNVGSGLFFTQGNAWGTQASVGNSGLKVKITETTNAGVYELTDYCDKKGSWDWRKWWFVDNVNSDATMYVDYDNQANFLWTITPMESKIYRFSPSTTNPYDQFAVGQFVGLDRTKSASNTVLTWNNSADGGAFIDWQLIPAGGFDMEAYVAQKKIYDAAMKLKGILDEAEAANIDVAAQITVYNNTGSTEAQLNEAITAVEKAIAYNDYVNATPDNPAVVTAMFIKNPSYDNDKKDNWSWTATGNGDMGTGYSAAEFYEKVFDVNQTLSELNEGVYAVDVQAFYRAGWGDGSAYTAYTSNDPQSKDVKLYAESGSDTFLTPITTPYPEAGAKVGTGTELEVTTVSGDKIYIPQNMQAAESYFVDKNRYHNTLLFGCEGGEVKIGLKNSKSVAGNWVLFDNWSLTYYGKSAAAYQMWSDNVLGGYPTTMGEGTLYTESYLTALTAATTGKTASNKAEVMANIAAADAAQADLDENVALWAEWMEQLVAAQKAYEDYEAKLPADNEEILNLLEYADSEDEQSESQLILAVHKLNNRSLEAEIAKVKKLVEDVIEAAKNYVEVGQDMTTFITNPDFSEGEKGWTGWKTVVQAAWPKDKKPMPVVNESCAEAFSSPNFDLYQEIEGLPLGIYQVDVQGFFRYGRGDNAWTEWNKQGEERADYVTVDDPAKGSPVFFYVNEKATPFKNIFEEDGRPGDSPLFEDLATPANAGRTPLTVTTENDVVTGVENCLRVEGSDGYLFFPDGMKSAHNYFNAGAYKQTTFSAVAHKGDVLRIGVKGHSNVGPATGSSDTNGIDSWAIFDNFKLTYMGKDKAIVKPVLEEAILVAKAKQKLALAKDVRDLLDEAIAAAEDAIANDVDDMFDVLAELWGVDVTASQQKIQELKAALTPFETAINNADEADEDARPLQSVIDEATSVRTTAQNYVDAKAEFTNADIDAIIAKMEELTDALKVPAAMYAASDDNEADATYLIVNPTYDDNKDKKDVAGWTLEGDEPGNYRANSGVYEVYNTKANTLVYQDLEKMPAGTYELSVQGIYRYGWAEDEFETYNADATANNNASLYVKVGEAEAAQKALPRLSILADVYGVEAETNEEGEYIVNNGEYTYKETTNWIWAQKTISDDKTEATGYIVPNQLASVTPFFEDETINTTSIIFKVGEDGKARIGINLKHVVEGDWTVWDNWVLKYYGANSAKDPDVVNGVKDASAVADVVKTEVFNLSGAQVKNGKGIAIVRQTLSNGTVRVKKVIVK